MAKLVPKDPAVRERLELARADAPPNPERRVTAAERAERLLERQRRADADRVLDTMFAELASSRRPAPPHITAADLRAAEQDLRRGLPPPRPTEQPTAALARALVVSRGLPMIAIGPRWSPFTWLRWLGYKLDRLAELGLGIVRPRRRRRRR
jgi:hypothetical protein